MPAAQKHWGRAIAHEVSAIADDGAALRFAVSAMTGTVFRLSVARLRHSIEEEDIAMTDLSPRFASAPDIACAAGAVALGIGYLVAAGAPAAYPAVNGAALLVGLGVLVVVSRTGLSMETLHGRMTPAIGMAMLATALLAEPVEGASRWIHLGGLAIQPSLILLPSLLIGFARVRTPASVAGAVAAVAAVAIQPDRAMAGMLVAGFAAGAMMRPGRSAWAVLAVAAAGFVVTLLRPDALPAVPFVDGILSSAFAVHPLAGVAVTAGSALLLVPALAGWRRGGGDRAGQATFGAAWLAAIAAAALGNYPTPVVGYGGSAILGYLLALGLLATAVRRPVATHGQAARREAAGGGDGGAMLSA